MKLLCNELLCIDINVLEQLICKGGKKSGAQARKLSYELTMVLSRWPHKFLALVQKR